MGFAVVADEVRSLALRCSEASHGTTALIEDAIAKTRTGVTVSEKVSRSFQQIYEQTGEATRLVEAVTGASVAQSSQVDDIVGAMEKIDTVTKRGMVIAQENTAVSKTMTSQSEELRGMVGVLQQFVNGRG